MDEEVKFYTEGLGMKIVRQREVNGARNVFVAYGEETLASKNGGEEINLYAGVLRSSVPVQCGCTLGLGGAHIFGSPFWGDGCCCLMMTRHFFAFRLDIARYDRVVHAGFLRRAGAGIKEGWHCTLFTRNMTCSFFAVVLRLLPFFPWVKSSYSTPEISHPAALLSNPFATPWPSNLVCTVFTATDLPQPNLRAPVWYDEGS